MRATTLLCSAVIGACLLGGQQAPDIPSTTSDDPYSIAFVNSALQFFKRAGKEGTYSFEAKNFTHLSPSLPQLGDGVSIAVLKIYDEGELIKPENANAYLTVVRTAFSDRNRVSEKSNKEPRVTLFVLDYLQEKEVSDPGIEKRIDYVRQCVGNFTCSPQSEFEFFKNH